MTVDNTDSLKVWMVHTDSSKEETVLSLNIVDSACYGIVNAPVLQFTFTFFCQFQDALVSRSPIFFQRVM